MSKTVVSELKDKMLNSGSRLNLFLGINVVIFVLVKITGVVEFLFRINSGVSDWLVRSLSMPGTFTALLYKFWTPLTYMFTHEGFFHFLFNMLWLYWMGRIFEDFLNARQFVFTYIAGGLAGAFLFLLAFNILPAFTQSAPSNTVLLGASGAVMAILAATATLLPDYTIRLLLLGDVKLKYIFFVYVLLDIILMRDNPGGSFAHLGGALLGFLYIRGLRGGSDWSKIFQYKRKTLKVVSKGPVTRSKTSVPDQEVIDRILDKISRSGYDNLTKTEKEQLFNASKSDESKER